MGEQFGHYRLDELIGRGGMGDVYRAFDTVKQRTVALKRLPANLAADHEFQARFRREAELAARLTEPHIIPIHDYGEIDGQLFIDMRLISGTDLAKEIRQVGPLPPARAVSIIAQLASALAAAHAERLVHRDVKPSNVLISRTDRGEDFVHLADFGVARNEAATPLTATGSAIGTVDYMAPEQFGDGPIDHRVDVYALGCVLYEALTAGKPFRASGPLAKMNAHLNTPPPRPSQHRPDIPPGLDQVVAQAMAKHPDQRFSSTTELAIRAQQSLHGLPAARLAGDAVTGGEVAGDGATASTTPVTTGGQPLTTPGHLRPGPPPPRTDHPWPAQAAFPPPPPPVVPTPASAAAQGGAGRSGSGRRGLLIAAALVVAVGAVAAVVFLVPRIPAGQSPPTSATAAAGSGTTGDPPPGADGGSAAGTRLDVRGYATGTLVSPQVTCTRLADSSWSWTATGSIDGSPLEITFNTNNYRGAGVYRTTGITDEQGGLLTVYAGTVAFATNGADTGTLTVADDERSGSIDAELDQGTGVDQRLQLSGSWRCS